MSSKPPKDERRARSEQMKAEREAAARASERRTRLLVAVAVLAAVGLIGVAVVASQSGTGDNAAVPTGVEAPDGGAPYGDDTAPVVMDEWVDFSCPACATFTAALGDTISEQVAAGELQVVYHPVSFINAGSARAANAFGCAVDQGQTNEFYDAVFAVQGSESDGGATNDELIEYGTSRADTHEVCGDIDNGFGLLVSLGLLGDGDHQVRVYADGSREIGRASFKVVTFGAPFVRGLSGIYDLSNFPSAGDVTTIQWQESIQNFTLRAR